MRANVDFESRVKVSWSKAIAKMASYAILTALPLCGLVLFFEVTRPAGAVSEGHLTKHLSDALWRTASPGRLQTARFNGVSAQLKVAENAKATKVFSAGDAEQLILDIPSSRLQVGYRSEFVTSDGRRLALRVVRRQLVTDQVVPDNARIMDIAPASTAPVVSFVWGQWRYDVEIKDLGSDNLAVQKSL